MFVLNIIYLAAEELFEENAESRYFVRYFQYWAVINWFWITLALMGSVYKEKNIFYYEKFQGTTLRTYAFWAVLVVAYLFLPRLTPLSHPLVFKSTGLFF